MKPLFIIIAAIGTGALSGCGVYSSYQRPEGILPDSLYRDNVSVTVDSVDNFGTRPWTEVFTSPTLQALIRKGLDNNTDLSIARLRIEQAEASLTASRLAFLPSLSLSPQGTISSFGGASASKTYSIPLTASWQIDLFGRLRNAKEQAKVMVESSKAYKQAVQTQLIATIAQEYYRLALLREQLSITEQTADVWAENVRAMRIFMQEGQYTDAAVSQAEANYNSVAASVLELRRQISESENTLSVLTGDVPHAVESGNLDEWTSPGDYSIGVPLSLLSARPDVRQAEMNLAAAFYATNEARAAFYPAITLSGTAGWTNVAGIITNPGKILLEAIGSITQPLFQNGRLRADLKIAQSQQEEAKLNFRQALLNAGMEVNNALTQVQTYRDKADYQRDQVTALERTVKATRLLMENGSANYLEVLTAQENLLSARLGFLQNKYNEIASFISLYQALGGGKED